MQHCDDEDLALMAMGEAGSSADSAHVQQCSRCQSRIDQLGAVVSATRTLTSADHPVAPPQGVWESIAAELDLELPRPAVVSLDSARSRRRRMSGWIIAAAAVAGIAVGSAATIGLLGSGGSEELVAQATLDPIENSGVSGTAVVQTIDGSSVLVVSVPNLPNASDAYYEVWMATPDTSKMVALGTLNAGHEGRFTLPDGMDMRSYPVVDVSLEHFDGDNSHSATSVVRGSLTA